MGRLLRSRGAAACCRAERRGPGHRGRKDSARHAHPRRPRVVANRYDNTSILKLIEWRYGLAPLTARDASNDIDNLGSALNLSNFFPTVPVLPNPAPPPPNECPSASTSSADMSTSEVGLE